MCVWECVHFCGLCVLLCDCAVQTDKTEGGGELILPLCVLTFSSLSLVHTQIFARAGQCLRSSVCVYQTMCAHPLVAICSTSQQAAVLAAPSIWLLRSAVLVTCPRCPWGKWNLTLVSSPLHTVCRWRCNQLSLPLNGTDCSSNLKQTGEQNSNCFYTEIC